MVQEALLKGFTKLDSLTIKLLLAACKGERNARALDLVTHLQCVFFSFRTTARPQHLILLPPVCKVYPNLLWVLSSSLIIVSRTAFECSCCTSGVI